MNKFHTKIFNGEFFPNYGIMVCATAHILTLSAMCYFTENFATLASVSLNHWHPINCCYLTLLLHQRYCHFNFHEIVLPHKRKLAPHETNRLYSK